MAKVVDRRSVVRNLALLSGTLPFAAACAHQARHVPRIGFLTGAQYTHTIAAFRDELRRLGYIEGENLILEMRLSGANPSDQAVQAAQLGQMDLELIVAAALPTALEVRRVNPNVPMVIATCPGMVSNGFAQSLERPGGNVTGMDELPPGLTRRRMTLLKTAAPEVSRVALLSTTPGRGGHETQLADAEQAAAGLGVTVKPYRVTSADAFEGAFAAIVADGMDGLVNFQGGLSLTHRQRIVDFAAERHIPAIYQATLFAEAGGLMAWAPDLEDQYRIAARYADQILRGANAGDLPIRHPSQYFLTINAGAARGLSLTLPPSLLNEATRIIE